ncbi:hypothetical protein [Actinomycetospora straminea]|uniref:hypothetical protein n=1 Tax=Actinomycetospora straminea TaxID=663607 RepID=UPI002365F9CF|nr:hypothetical protein [Actinomycetospora straminea]MDD7934476.1 hypothetical protein [Actinomycetospora straminea]
MTVRTTPSAVPPGMPAHLWEAAKRDVRGVIPDWLRSAKENGADAPAHIREVARRAAKAGAGLGMAIAVGTQVDAAASETDGAAVTTVAHTTPEVPAVPGEGPALAESFRVLDPQGVGDGWLSVEMYQDVVVNEGADAAYNVDAFQYMVISDDAGQRYVFKEHHHAAVSEPPARETDLLIHERGQVHVVENPDGSFSVDTVSYDRSVNGVSEPAPAGGLDDEPADVTVPDDDPPDLPDWTPPTGLAPIPAPAVSPEDHARDEAPAVVPDPLDDLDAPDPTPGAGDPGGAPDEPETSAAASPDDDGPGNDPPDASELAV